MYMSTLSTLCGCVMQTREFSSFLSREQMSTWKIHQRGPSLDIMDSCEYVRRTEKWRIRTVVAVNRVHSSHDDRNNIAVTLLVTDLKRMHKFGAIVSTTTSVTSLKELMDLLFWLSLRTALMLDINAYAPRSRII